MCCGRDVNLTQCDMPAPATASAATVDETRIAELVGKLSDKEPTVREQSFAELARYGPGAFAIFEKLKPSQPYLRETAA